MSPMPGRGWTTATAISALSDLCADHRERMCHGRGPDAGSVTWQHAAFRDHALTSFREPEADRSHRLFRTAAARPGDSGDRDRDRRPGTGQGTCGHRTGDLLADRAMGLD